MSDVLIFEYSWLFNNIFVFHKIIFIVLTWQHCIIYPTDSSFVDNEPDVDAAATLTLNEILCSTLMNNAHSEVSFSLCVCVVTHQSSSPERIQMLAWCLNRNSFIGRFEWLKCDVVIRESSSSFVENCFSNRVLAVHGAVIYRIVSYCVRSCIFWRISKLLVNSW